MATNLRFLLFFTFLLGCASQICLNTWEGRMCFPPKTIVEVKTMTPISWEEFIDRLSSAHIVYVGERHSRKEDHILQLNIAKALFENGIDLAIGIEMVMRSRQEVLDHWVAGEIDEKELLKELKWDELWGHDFSHYKEIFLFARENNIPIIALNAPPGLVKKVALYGLHSILPAEKQYIAQDIDLTDKKHKEFIKEEFEKHKAFGKGKEKNFAYFYEAQCVWDETMAETIANYVKEHPEKHMLVLAGKGHIMYKFGIPKRAWRRLPLSYLTIISTTDGEFDSEIADFVYLIR